MVGSVERTGRRYALLKVDKLLYQVKVGDYLGQNFGKITKIGETDIALREIVQDAAGEWIERTTSLELAGEGAMKNSQENRIMTKWRAAALVLVLAVGSPLALAQNLIQSISSSQQAGSEVVRIELSEPLTAVPAGFAIQSPPRVAIDLPGVGSALGRSSIEINQGNLRTVNVAQAGERTRVVLNLRQSSNYRAQLDGKALLIIMDSAAPSAVAGAAPEQPVFAPNANRDQLPLRDVDFRRGSDGTGRVVVNLANSQVGVDIRQQGKNLVVDFLRSSLPESLRRRLDVSDFGTPVQTVSTVQSGDRVRMVVEPTGNWEHSAYQSDNQFVLEVRPVKVDPNKLTQGPGYQGEKLSLNFQNIDVRALLQVIADFTNFNVVTSDTVTGSLTLRLKDVPWDQALDIILQAKGLGMRKSGNVIWIAPKDELAAKEQAELEARKKVTELEPLRTQAFQLNYTKAQDVANGLTGRGGGGGGGSGGGRSRILSERGSVLFETAHEPALRDRHSLQARGSPGTGREDRHSGAPGADRSAHRRSERHVRPVAGRAPRRRRSPRLARRHSGLEPRRPEPGRRRRQLRRHRRPDRASRRRPTSRARSSSTCRPSARAATTPRRSPCRSSARRPTGS